jgi:hypothetical protein
MRFNEYFLRRQIASVELNRAREMLAFLDARSDELPNEEYAFLAWEFIQQAEQALQALARANGETRGQNGGAQGEGGEDGSDNGQG